MKRICFVVIAFTLIMSGCGNNGGTQEASNDIGKTDESQVETVDTEQTAKDAYRYLNSAVESTDLVMTTVLDAWYFAINHNDDEYGLDYSSGCYDFSKEVGIPSSGDVSKAMNSVLEGTTYEALGEKYYGMAFSEPSYCVACALKCLENAQITGKLDEVMSETKTMIKEIMESNPDASYLDTLKQYYSEVESYREYATNPTGSYLDAQSTVETYRSNLKSYKNDLSFELE